jgi:hypothetical protein
VVVADDMPWRVSEGDEAGEGEQINWDLTDEGVIVYDEDDPDAWIHVDLDEDLAPEKQLFSLCPRCGAVFPRDSTDGGLQCDDCGAEYVP